MNASPHIQWLEMKRKEDEKEVYTERYYGKVDGLFTLRNDLRKRGASFVP
jgi:hypothetical protein